MTNRFSDITRLSSLRTTPALIALAILLFGLPAASGAAKLEEVRIGEYDGYTRLVLQFDERTRHGLRRPPGGSGAIRIQLNAASATGQIASRSQRIAGVSLVSVSPERSEALVELHDPNLQFDTMVLQNPPRLVLDILAGDRPKRPSGGADTVAWIETTKVETRAPVQVAAAAAVPLAAAGTTPPVAAEAAKADTAPPASPAPEVMEVPIEELDDTPTRLVVADLDLDLGQANHEPFVVADAMDSGAGPVVGGRAARSGGRDPYYSISRFEIRYAEPHAKLPPTAELQAIEVVLGKTDDGWVGPGAGAPTQTVRLSDSFDGDTRFHASAILAVDQAIVNNLNGQGFVGVLAEPDANDIAPATAADLRPTSRTTLGIVVWVGRVKDIRTFASGQRVDPEQRLDNPVHAPIIKRSPVQPAPPDDLIKKDEIDAYTARLNRHPGRRVDALISPAREPGGAYLDYLVSEWKPWWIYFGGANTGTDNTTKWRQRMGFTDTQLTNHDDLLTVDYVTGNFSKQLNAVSLVYDTPFWFVPNTFVQERLRFRPFANYLKYNASVFGFAGTPFKGESWWGGGDFTLNVFQHESLFVDVYGGLRWAHHNVKNGLIPGQDTGDDFFLPRWGIKSQRVGEWSAFFANFNFEANVASVADTQQQKLNQFGRGAGIDKDWVVGRMDAAAWTYLEPLIFGDKWKDPTTPSSSTLAHELYGAIKGQYSFNNKLIPQEMMIAGGLYTVRGYKEAITSGDSAAIGNIEYRVHIPRLFPIEKQPRQVPGVGDFRLARQQVYGSPDWDLIGRVFFDLGWTGRKKRSPADAGYNEALMATGLGLELQIKRNLSLRFDYGWILNQLESNPGQDVGDGRAHFAGRILY